MADDLLRAVVLFSVFVTKTFFPTLDWSSSKFTVLFSLFLYRFVENDTLYVCILYRLGAHSYTAAFSSRGVRN